MLYTLELPEFLLNFISHNLILSSKVLKQLRKLHWDDKEESDFAINSICAVWNMKYPDIRYVASIVAGLVYYHNWIGPAVIDWVLEDIRMCMEINEPKYNQRRVAVMKFFGELYNYRLLDSNLIIKVLYSLITFGTGMFGDQRYNKIQMKLSKHFPSVG